MNDVKMARLLGWASVVIAASEILMPKTLTRHLLGIEDHEALTRSLGVRELAAGVTILSQDALTPTLAAGLWSRVAGDAMDLALLATAAPRSRNPMGFAAATALVFGITALDAGQAWKVQRRLLENNHRRSASKGTASTTKPGHATQRANYGPDARPTA